MCLKLLLQKYEKIFKSFFVESNRLQKFAEKVVQKKEKKKNKTNIVQDRREQHINLVTVGSADVFPSDVSITLYNILQLHIKLFRSVQFHPRIRSPCITIRNFNFTQPK